MNAVSITIVLFLGCSSSERIDELEQRISELEDELRKLKRGDSSGSSENRIDVASMLQSKDKPRKKASRASRRDSARREDSSSVSALGLLMNSGLASKREEIPLNMRGIKIAELIYEANFDQFVTAAAYPSVPTKSTQQWIPGSSGGFATMGWSPDGDVRGSYSVTTTTTNFTIMGLSDVDGDNRYATYIATKSTHPTLISPPDVY